MCGGPGAGAGPLLQKWQLQLARAAVSGYTIQDNRQIGGRICVGRLLPPRCRSPKERRRKQKLKCRE